MKMFFIVILFLTASLQADNSVYEMLDDELVKLEKLSVEEMHVEVNLTKQMLLVHNGTPNGESTMACAFPCSTGPGKYEMVPSDKKSEIYETGPGSEGNRPSYTHGGEMKHCLRLKMNNPDGSEAYVAIHSSNGEYVPRIPTTHGCVRVPRRVALALFKKLWNGVPGSSKGDVKRKIPVIYTGETPVLDFGSDK